MTHPTRPFERVPISWKLFSLALAFLCFSAIAGRTSLWFDRGFPIIPSTAIAIICVAIVLLLLTVLNLSQLKALRPAVSAFAWILVFLFFSDWLARGYNFFQGPIIRGEILLLGVLGVWLIRPTRPWVPALILLGTIAMFLTLFVLQTQGGTRLLFSDDHATFLFRLSLLKKTFPSIPFYYPFWNGGMDARDFFATGALNIFFLSAPIVYLTDLFSSYSFIVAITLFIFLPVSVWGAAWFSGLRTHALWFAPLLALTTGLTWYRWALKYGTMGFVITAALVPLNLVLASYLVDREKDISGKAVTLFIITSTLMLLWSPSAIIFIPLVLIFLFNLFVGFPAKKRPTLTKVIVILFLLNAPWLYILWSVSNVSSFIKTGQVTHEEIAIEQTPNAESPQPTPPVFKHKAGSINFPKSLKVLRESAQSTNPLILFLGLPGLFLLNKRLRASYIITAAWLFVLGTIVVPLKPQLEFDRMLVILSLCLCLPAAKALEVVLRVSSPFDYLPRVICTGFLLCGPLSAGSLMLNRTVEQYHFSDELVPAMANAIRENHDNGRILFSGFMLHELDGGHLAPLTEMTGVPLMASSQFHNLWKYTQIFPESFIARSDQGIEEYLNLYNVSAVFAHERYWKDYFTHKPELYEKVWTGKQFILFKRRSAPHSYVHSGEAENLTQTTTGMTFKAVTKDIVLKFNYFPFLESSACTISGTEISPEVTFIKLSDCPLGETIEIRSKSTWERVLG